MLLYPYVCYVFKPIHVRLHAGGGHGGGHEGGHLIDFSVLWWENFELKYTNFENVLVMDGLIPAVTTVPSNTQNFQWAI